MKEVVKKYLEIFFNKQLDLNALRDLLTDDFIFEGPMMRAENADDFITKLRGFGEKIEMKAEIHEIIGEANTFVARYDFILPDNVKVPATEWYKVKTNKIECMYLYCDPKNFIPGQKEV